jgi:hypothetical protein
MTLGEGFLLNQREGQIYPSLVSNKFMFDHDNLAMSGYSNYRIFLRTSQAIQSQQYEIVFCQWSELNRLWLSPGPNAWYYTTGKATDVYRCRDLILDVDTQNQLADQILLLNHDYQTSMDLIDLSNTLTSLAQCHQTKLIFINGMLPWQSDLITKFQETNQLSDWSRGMLDADTRDDSEVLVLFEQLQQKFSTLDQNRWVNVFDSFQSMSLDHGPLGHHPGPKSHQLMADRIHNYLEQGTL